jgi:hypothetical protein
MVQQILHILDVEVVKDFILKLEFNDGTVKSVDVRPNGADLAPKALYELQTLEAAA